MLQATEMGPLLLLLSVSHFITYLLTFELNNDDRSGSLAGVLVVLITLCWCLPKRASSVPRVSHSDIPLEPSLVASDMNGSTATLVNDVTSSIR